MLPLLVWVAGCVFGWWVIAHYGLWHEAFAFAVCASVCVWVVGGASWIGKRLQSAAARQTRAAPPSLRGPRLTPEQIEQLALKRSAEAAASQQSGT
jgi:hypothetical protein